MAAPDLTRRMTCFVQKTGTDDPSYNAVGSPYSRLTIAAALADLAANYIEPASSTNFHIVAVGPGVFVEAATALPPWTFIVGSCDGENNENTEIQLTGNLTLSGAWSANATARGGVGEVRIRASSGTPIIDFTMPAPVSGNPSRTIETWNTRHNLTQELFEATSTADVRRRTNTIQDGTNTDLISDTGGTSQTHGFNLAAASWLVTDKASFAMVASYQGIVMTNAAATFTVRSLAAAGCAMRLVLSSLRAILLTQTAPGVLAFAADDISMPVRASVTFGGTATLAANVSYLNDAQGVGYTPAVPANWPAGTVNVQQALDASASGMAGHAGNGTLAATNNAGNTTITPTKATWTQQMTFTGAAGTRIMILDVATPPIAGDTIDLFISKTDGGGIVVTVRNAAAGGTLLATFADGTGVATARGQFVYGTIATGYAANAWVAQAFQTPATT